MNEEIFERVNNIEGYTEQEKDIMKLTLILSAAINEIEDKETRDRWCMTLAGDLLHDVDAEWREAFLTGYEELRSGIVDICGS